MESSVHTNIDPFLNVGIAGVILLFIGVGAWRSGKWLAGMIKNAVFEPDTGLLSLYRRNVDNTEQFLKEAADRDKNQQHLCEAHARNLANLGTILDGHNKIAGELHSDLQQFRRDAIDPTAPSSTIETNKKLDRIASAIIQACRATKEIVSQTDPDIADAVKQKCDLIEKLLANK